MTKIFAAVTFVLFLPSLCHATWQETLEGYFDVVETFDELQDWRDGLTGNPNGIVTTLSLYGLNMQMANFHGGSHGVGRVDILPGLYTSAADCTTYSAPRERKYSMNA